MVEQLNQHTLSQQLIVNTSGDSPTYFFVGRRGNHVKLSASAYYLLRSVAAGVSFETLAERLTQRRGRPVTADHIEATYRQTLAEIVAIESKTVRLPFGFWFRARCLSASSVRLIARYLKVAFHPIVAGGLIIAMLAVLALSFRQLMEPSFFSLGNSYIESFVVLYLLFIVSVMIHEFGHASACAYFGVQPNEIGWTMYWIYPAFYTDVNAAWQLPRWQRVVVDLAGFFFQCLVAIIYLILYRMFGWDVWRVAFLVVMYNAALMLSPLFRFDGYWVVSDALGVPNLWQQVRRVLRTSIDRLRGRSSPALPWSMPTIVSILAYMLLGMSFFLYFTWQLAPDLWEMVLMYPASLLGLINDLSTPPHRLATGRIQSVFSSTFVVIGLLLGCINLGRFAWSAVRAAIHHAANRVNQPPLTVPHDRP